MKSWEINARWNSEIKSSAPKGGSNRNGSDCYSLPVGVTKIVLGYWLHLHAGGRASRVGAD